MSETAVNDQQAVYSNGMSRPDGGGKAGIISEVHANFFDLYQYSGKPYPIIFKYDVKVTKVEQDEQGRSQPMESKENKKILHSSIQQELLFAALTAAENRGEAEITLGKIKAMAYDGAKFAFTPLKFDFDENSFYVDISASGGPKRYFKIHFKCIGPLDPNVAVQYCKGNRDITTYCSSQINNEVQSIIQAYDVAMQARTLSDQSYKKCSQGRFFDTVHAYPIADGAEIMDGFFQSVRPTQRGLCLNLDRATSAFVARGLLSEVLAKVLNGREDRHPMLHLTTEQHQRLRRRLIGVEVKVTHPVKRKKYRLTGISPKSARDTTFTLPEGRVITVLEYFYKKYQIKLGYPDLQCAILGHHSMVPMELCEIVPGTMIHPPQMTPAITQGLIARSATRPEERKGQIQKLRKSNAYGACKVLEEFDIGVDRELVQVEARILSSPKVIYKDNRTIDPRNGSWNLAQSNFLASGDPLKGLMVINASLKSHTDCERYIMTQLEACKKVGMRIEIQHIEYGKCNPKEDPTQVMKDIASALYTSTRGAAIPQLFMVLMEPQDNTLYDAIKKVAALGLTSPVQTQCVNVNKAMRGQPAYCANVAMKMNMKLGGINHTVDVKELPRDCMLIGVDLTHPPPGKGLPSIITSVATVNESYSRHNSELAIQYNEDDRKEAQEVILQSEPISIKHFEAWQKCNNGLLPSSIILFRDGVSEGEYESVMNREVDHLKSSASKMKAGYKPKITFIICGKRHHVVFFGQNGDRHLDCSGNLPAGTVVDRGIVHPVHFDFYQQCHAALKGTARPIHYVVLKDDNHFTSDEIQRIIYDLSHTYACATKSVSLPPVVTYAHEMAERLRSFMYGNEGSILDSSSSHSPGDVDVDRQKRKAKMEEIIEKINRKPLNDNLTPFKRTPWFL